jgi:hypothetical protein
MTVSVLVKIVLTPLLIAVATLVGRRWGPGLSGWLAGFPLTSGPVSVFLALEQGPEFAARAAGGTLLGLLSMATFCLVYARLAHRASWLASAAAGLGAFAICTLLLEHVALPVLAAFAVVSVGLGVIAAAMPRTVAPMSTRASPPWDLPIRMAVAAGLVLLLTGLAAWLGPSLSGLLSPVPAFALILAAFAHRTQGPGAAAQLLRAVVIGSFAFAAFFLVVGTGLTQVGLAATYGLAALASLAVNGLALAVVRRGL